MGRYFATGATLGSISGLVALVLIWSWMTIHLGLLGFLVGWIPAGLAAAAVWVTMVVFWVPVLVIGVLIAMIALALGGGRHHDRDWETPPVASPPREAPAPLPIPPEEAAPRDDAPPPEQEQTAPPPPVTAPPPPPEAPPLSASPKTPPSAPATPPPAPPRTPNSRQTEDLGSDAAAAGDTSHTRPQ
ncbi:MAG TPA: hypothetical protein VHY32_10155 [Caulobacteraceae bacterium]|nr:hypothetical protein [Caulobacteraceae bacterium]